MVGSTDVSASLPARVGVGGPKHAIAASAPNPHFVANESPNI
jgi:hypothetical protein